MARVRVGRRRGPGQKSLVRVYKGEGLRYVGEVEFGFSPASRMALCGQFRTWPGSAA